LQITLYTTEHCPVCSMVKNTLKQKGVEFNIVNDIEIMTMKGFKSAPMLEVDESIMNAKDAINWIKSL
jgi:glutaredoxin